MRIKIPESEPVFDKALRGEEFYQIYPIARNYRYNLMPTDNFAYELLSIFKRNSIFKSLCKSFKEEELSEGIKYRTENMLLIASKIVIHQTNKDYPSLLIFFNSINKNELIADSFDCFKIIKFIALSPRDTFRTDFINEVKSWKDDTSLDSFIRFK